MFDGTPWASGDIQLQHSADTARVLAYAATSGSEGGVVSPDDCKVRALSTPGSSVRIGPGAAASRNFASSGRSQSFVGRVISDTNVAIAATGSGSGRTDLICVVFTDPTVAGSGGVAGQPGFKPLVISGVAATATRLQDQVGYEYAAGFALARVTLPASTSTVTSGMITDLRSLVSPRTATQVFVANSEGKGRVNGVYVSPNAITSPTFVRWPHRAEWDIEIPAWATSAVLVATVHGLSSRTGDVWGEIRAVLGIDDSLVTTFTAFDEAWDNKPARVSLGAAGRLVIPVAMRGTTQKVKIHGRRVGGVGTLTAMEGTASLMQVFFEEKVV